MRLDSMASIRYVFKPNLTLEAARLLGAREYFGRFFAGFGRACRENGINFCRVGGKSSAAVAIPASIIVANRMCLSSSRRSSAIHCTGGMCSPTCWPGL